MRPDPVKVSYSYVRENIPKLLFPNLSGEEEAEGVNAVIDEGLAPKPQFDIVLHIGVAGERNYYTLETLAHRDNYTNEDVEGKTMKDDTLWKKELQAPDILHTSFDTGDVWRRWKAGLIVSRVPFSITQEFLELSKY